MIQWLIDVGHSDVTIVKRTGHKSLGSLDNYNHLRGCPGILLQKVVFNDIEDVCSSNSPYDDNDRPAKREKRISTNISGTVSEVLHNLELSNNDSVNLTIDFGKVSYETKDK